MKSLTVAEFKSSFSEVLAGVKRGEEFLVTYGRSRKKLGIFVPASKSSKPKERKIGAFDGKVKIRISTDWKLSDEEFLKS